MSITDKTAEEAGRGYQILSAKKYEQSISGDGNDGSESPEENPFDSAISGEASMDNSGISGEPQIIEPGISGEPSVEEPTEEVPNLPF